MGLEALVERACASSLLFGRVRFNADAHLLAVA
jgi:hypothetical protein